MDKSKQGSPELEISFNSASGVTRRDLLKSAVSIAPAAILPFGFGGQGLMGMLPPYGKSNSFNPTVPAKNPSWYGFNLLEYFSTDPDWMKYFPYKDDGMFLEDDFRWIRDWGFNWVRLPMDYRFWTAPDLMTIDQKKVEPIDRAIKLGEKYGIHVNICLHRAPGLCILDTMDEKLTGITITKEKTNLYSDAHALDAFVHQWTFFAGRYKGISSDRLSFNLVNEPIALPSAAEMAELQKNGAINTPDLFKAEFLQKHTADYIRVAKLTDDAIRAVDPQRVVVTDGYPAGVLPIPALAATGMFQSSHTYNPVQVTHYQCEWARGLLTGNEPVPTWPLKDAAGKIICDRKTLQTAFQPWGAISAQGVPIHFGEMGCYKHTPPDVVLAWFDDSLDAIDELKSGWALWNFRGPFGIVDTERAGTKFEDWHGHQLDRPLLTLLQKKMKHT
jgi:endoglucanase